MKSVSCFFVVAALLLRSVCFPLNVLGSDAALAAIGEADNVLGRAFGAVLELESIDANVSELMVKLNEAGELLARAKMAYRVGNFSEAFSKAEACSLLANDVLTEASVLKVSALEDFEAGFSRTVMFSITGATVFISFMVLVWLLFVPFYERRLLRMKPEAASDVDT